MLLVNALKPTLNIDCKVLIKLVGETTGALDIDCEVMHNEM